MKHLLLLFLICISNSIVADSSPVPTTIEGWRKYTDESILKRLSRTPKERIWGFAVEGNTLDAYMRYAAFVPESLRHPDLNKRALKAAIATGDSGEVARCIEEFGLNNVPPELIEQSTALLPSKGQGTATLPDTAHVAPPAKQVMVNSETEAKSVSAKRVFIATPDISMDSNVMTKGYLYINNRKPIGQLRAPAAELAPDYISRNSALYYSLVDSNPARVMRATLTQVFKDRGFSIVENISEANLLVESVSNFYFIPARTYPIIVSQLVFNVPADPSSRYRVSAYVINNGEKTDDKVILASSGGKYRPYAPETPPTWCVPAFSVGKRAPSSDVAACKKSLSIDEYYEQLRMQTESAFPITLADRVHQGLDKYLGN